MSTAPVTAKAPGGGGKPKAQNKPPQAQKPPNGGQKKGKQDAEAKGGEGPAVSVQARGKGQGFQSKNLFEQPFRVSWPPVPSADQTLIYQKMASTFKDLQARPPRVKEPRESVAKSEAPGPTPSPALAAPPASGDFQDTIDMAPPAKRPKLNPPASNPEPTAAFSTATPPIARDPRLAHLVLGFNAVTKKLEKNQLALVVVSKQIEPPRVLAHLPVLCALRGKVPLCPLADSSTTLGQYFGLRSVLAIGFKKSLEGEGGPVLDLMNFIIAKTPKIDIPWLTDHIRQEAAASIHKLEASGAAEAPSVDNAAESDAMEVEESKGDVMQVEGEKRTKSKLILQPVVVKTMEHRFRSTSTKVQKSKPKPNSAPNKKDKTADEPKSGATKDKAKQPPPK